jgi:hypothetical protein
MTKKEHIPGMSFIIPFKVFRKTPNVEFDIVPEVVKGLSSIDRVLHNPGSVSPSIEGHGDHVHWYMHPNQEDNLMVCQGKRLIELFTKEHNKVEHFEVTPDYIKHEGEVLFEGPAILGWSTNVFHRVHSPDGSVSINFAKHTEGFDIRTNFNIYDLDTESGKFECAREGHLDQM